MPADPVRRRRWADHRGTLEAIAWKYRTNSPWRDLPEELGSFRTVHKRLIRWAVDGTWEKIFAAVLAAADAIDDIGWTVVITNRTDTSDQLTNPSKRHALAGGVGHLLLVVVLERGTGRQDIARGELAPVRVRDDGRGELLTLARRPAEKGERERLRRRGTVAGAVGSVTGAVDSVGHSW